MVDFTDSYGAIESHEMEVRKRGKGSSYSRLPVDDDDDDDEETVPTLQKAPIGIVTTPKKTFGKYKQSSPLSIHVMLFFSSHLTRPFFYRLPRSQVLFLLFIFWRRFPVYHCLPAQQKFLIHKGKQRKWES